MVERTRVIIIAVYGAAVGLIDRIFIQGLCHNIPTLPAGMPDPGTPAAAYCGVVAHGYDWLTFAVAGALVSACLFAALRNFGSGARVAWALGVVLLLAVANAVVAGDLNNFVPAP